MIRRLRTEEHGTRSLALVEITNPRDPRVVESVSWEFVCNVCGEMCVGLREHEARDEIAAHVCTPE